MWIFSISLSLMIFLFLLTIVFIVSIALKIKTNYFDLLKKNDYILFNILFNHLNINIMYLNIINDIYLINIINNIEYKNEKILKILFKIKLSLKIINIQQQLVQNKKTKKIINKESKKILNYYKKILSDILKSQTLTNKLINNIILNINDNILKLTSQIDTFDDIQKNKILKNIWYKKHLILFMKY